MSTIKLQMMYKCIVVVLVLSFVAIISKSVVWALERFYGPVSVLEPEFDFIAVEKRLMSSAPNTNASIVRSDLLKKLAPELKVLISIAWYFYITADDNNSDKYAVWENALKKVGLPPSTYKSSLERLNSKTYGKKGTIATFLSTTLTDDDVTAPLTDTLSKGTFAPANVTAYKNHLLAAFSTYGTMTSDADEYNNMKIGISPNSKKEDVVGVHARMLVYAWFIVLMDPIRLQNPNKLPKTALVSDVWSRVLSEAGFPAGMYDSLSKQMLELTKNMNYTFISLPFPKEEVVKLYDDYVKSRGSFSPTNVNAYKAAYEATKDISLIGQFSANPDAYTPQYIKSMQDKLKGNNTQPPQLPQAPQVSQVSQLSTPVSQVRTVVGTSTTTTTIKTTSNPLVFILIVTLMVLLLVLFIIIYVAKTVTSVTQPFDTF